MNESAPDGGKTIQSLQTAVAIVEYIRDHGEVGISEAADALGCSKSTVHHHVTTLAKEGYVERSNGRYSLGLRFVTLGGEVREHRRLYRLAKDDATDLADDTGETVRLVVEHEGKGLTLFQEAGGDADDVPTHLGTVEDLHCTAAGKALLAARPEDELEAYLDGASLTRYTDQTVTDRDALREELAAIRSRGVAFDDGERYDGVRSVAAAIDTDAGEPAAALCVSGPTERVDDERFRTTIPNEIQNVVGVVEINTTYSAWTEEC